MILRKIKLRVVDKLIISITVVLLSMIALQSYLNIRSFRTWNEKQEMTTLQDVAVDFNDYIDNLKLLAVSFSNSVASQYNVSDYYLQDNRQALLSILNPTYKNLSEKYDLKIMIINLEGSVYLRVHAPERYGDSSLPYQNMLSEVVISKRPAVGVEYGPELLSVRGVSPLFDGEQVIGVVAVELRFDDSFLNILKDRKRGVNYRIWIAQSPSEPEEDRLPGNLPSDLFLYSSTTAATLPINDEVYHQVITTGISKTFFLSNSAGESEAALLTPLFGYGNQIIGILEITLSRATANAVMQQTIVITVIVSLILAIIGLGLMGITTGVVVIRPLMHLTSVAQKQLEGDLNARVETQSQDEFGQLSLTFNDLTQKLQESIQNLEQQVIKARAAEISAQEELKERIRIQEELNESKEAERLFSRRLTRLLIAMNELSMAESVDVLCQGVIVKGLELGFSRLGLWLLAADKLHMIGTYGVDANGNLVDERNYSFLLSEREMESEIISRRVPLLMIEKDVLRDRSGTPIGEGAHAVAGLWDGEDIVGIISIDNLIDQAEITSRDCELLSLYASVVGHLYTLKLTQAQALAYQERLEAVLKSVPNPVFAKDKFGKYILFNSAYEQFFGIKSTDLLSKSVDEAWSSDDARLYHQKDLELMQKDDVQIYEHRLQTAFGLRDVIFTKACFHDAQGAVAGLVGTLTDITERKRSEEALRLYNQRLEILRQLDEAILAAQSPQAIASSALTHILRLINCQHAGVAKVHDEKQELRWLAVLSSKHTCIPTDYMETSKDNAFFQALSVGQMVVIKDLRIMTEPMQYQKMLIADGITAQIFIPLIVQDHLVGVLDLGNDTPDFLTNEQEEIVREISGILAVALQQSHLHEQVQRYAAELEERVRQRTEELENKNLELETFTYSVSHDLKAPLRGIDGYSRLLLEDYQGKLDDDGRKFLLTIRQATEHMNQLINDLLAYSRLERRSMTTSSIYLPPLIQGLLNERSGEIKERKVKVKVNLPFDYVNAEVEGVSQAIRNLIDNALKFTCQTDKPIIEIGGQQQPTSCILWVKDNGIGFDMQYHDRIFEIFQRLHRSEDFQGTGIGLALVRKVMQRLGGKVWATSAPGKGATFFLEFPQQDQKKNHERTPNSSG